MLHLNILDSLADRFSFYSALGMRMVETCQVGGAAVRVTGSQKKQNKAILSSGQAQLALSATCAATRMGEIGMGT